MKKLLCVTLLLGVVSFGLAQQSPAPTAIETMVATELAFAHSAREQGTRPAFAAFIADDGILFRPTPVKGKEWLAKNPGPAATGKQPWLSWYPAVADIAAAGDIGYTTGPWEFRPDIHDARAVAFGNFLTVWKKQADGSFKFVIDLGISNPQPNPAPPGWQLPKGFRQTAPGRQVKVSTEIEALLAREREFSRASATRGPQQSFATYAAADVRLFRNDQQPFVGKRAAVAALPASPVVWTWEPTFADVSRSGDLGYSYGTYRLTSADPAAKVETGNYYRIWKKQGNNWRVVADLLDPLPEPKRN
jgi:ketosteroid isomerase-like protein